MSTAPLTVRLDPGDPATSALHAEILASLPRSFRLAPAGQPGGADVALVSGACRAWADTARAALRAGARAVMLTAVDAGHPDTARTLAGIPSPAGVAVVVDSPWAQHPAVLDAAPLIAADLGAVTFITGAFRVPAGHRPPGRLAVEHLALVRAVAAPVVEVRMIAVGDSGYELVGTAGQSPVHLCATVSPDGVERGELCLLGADRQWDLTFGDTTLAGPPRVSRAGDDGESVRPAVYECAHRGAWRALHAAVTGGAPPPYGLDALRADVAALTGAAAATASAMW